MQEFTSLESIKTFIQNSFTDEIFSKEQSDAFKRNVDKLLVANITKIQKQVVQHFALNMVVE